MAERPIWEQLGTSFVQLYYQKFDTNREQLGAFYVRIIYLCIHNYFFVKCDSLITWLFKDF